MLTLLLCAVLWSDQGATPHIDLGNRVTIERVLRISDEDGGFLLAKPQAIGVAPDGSVLLAEGRTRLMKLDDRGRFQHTLTRKGKGPGELIHLAGFVARDQDVVVFDTMQSKLVRVDYTGKLLGETHLEGRFGGLLTVQGEQAFLYASRSRPSRTTGIHQVDRSLFVTDFDGNPLLLPLSFSVDQHVRAKDRRISTVPLTYLLSAADDGLLYLSHRPEYGVSVLDTDQREVVRTLKRPYPRVPIYDQNDRYPEIEFFNDIQQIAVHRNRLWVLTSTVRKEAGVRADIFERDGTYRGSTFLALPNFAPELTRSPRPLAVHEDLMWLWEWDEAGSYFLSCFRIHADLS